MVAIQIAVSLIRCNGCEKSTTVMFYRKVASLADCRPAGRRISIIVLGLPTLQGLRPMLLCAETPNRTLNELTTEIEDS